MSKIFDNNGNLFGSLTGDVYQGRTFLSLSCDKTDSRTGKDKKIQLEKIDFAEDGMISRVWMISSKDIESVKFLGCKYIRRNK